ncbi:MAG: hypothetical protein JJV97_03070 [SAR324 cluster bacterium]|nr:hypothetical protein [SAR324 cluster bacterium]
MTVYLDQFSQLYVVSDLHLQDSDVESTDKFLHLLEILPTRPAALILLGDVFQLWSSYSTNLSESQLSVVNALAEYRNRGGVVVLLAGNKDLLFKKKELGAALNGTNEDIFDVVSPDYVVMALNDEYRIVFYHGDSIDQKNYAHRLMKRLLRLRLIHLICRIFPNKTLSWMTNFNREQLGKFKKKSYYFPKDQWIKWLDMALLKYQAKLGVVGHFHPQELIETQAGKNGSGLVLPSWFGSHSYLYVDKLAYKVVKCPK